MSPSRYKCTLSVVMHTQTHFKPESQENYSTKQLTRKKHVQKRGELFSESGGTDSSDSSMISSNASDGNEELGVQPYLYGDEPKGNANITVLFYERTERVLKNSKYAQA